MTKKVYCENCEHYQGSGYCSIFSSERLDTTYRECKVFRAKGGWLRHPQNVKELAKEINKSVDQYWSRQIEYEELRDRIVYWSKYEGIKFFKGKNFKPTIVQRCGTRLDLVKKLLDGQQTKLM